MPSPQLTSHKVPLWNSLPTHLEARERLHYVAESRGIGLLTGPAGTGKTRLFSEIQADLEAKGFQVVAIDISGWSETEFAPQIAMKLQLGLSLKATAFETWTRLDQWATALRQLNHRQVLLLDHLERSVGSACTLDRLLGLFTGATACLLGCSEPVPESFKSVFQRHCPLKISLPRLTRQETTRYVSLQAMPQLRISPNGLATIHELSKGRVRSLDRISSLIQQAALDEEAELVDSSLVRDSAKEVRL